MGENDSNETDKGLISKIYKQLMELNTKREKKNQKVGRRLTQTFLQRRHTDGQHTHEKMLNITRHSRNADPNHKVPLTPARMALIKKSTSNKCWRGCGEKEHSYSCTVGRNVN